MEEEKKETTAPEEKPVCDGESGGCCFGKFFKKLGYNDHKLAYHLVAGVAVSAIALHLFMKYRSGGSCCGHR